MSAAEAAAIAATAKAAADACGLNDEGGPTHWILPFRSALNATSSPPKASDGKGLVHLLATGMGTREWKNPVDEKIIIAEWKAEKRPDAPTNSNCSAEYGPYYNAYSQEKLVFDYDYGPKNMLSDRIWADYEDLYSSPDANEIESSESKDDQPAGKLYENLVAEFRFYKHDVLPTRYALRVSCVKGLRLLRHWTLEGSMDGHSWVALSEHGMEGGKKDDGDADKSMTSECLTADWGIDPETVDDRYFSIFRIRITGEMDGGPPRFCLSSFELFGTVRDCPSFEIQRRNIEYAQP